jgi:hypothetical protein
MRAVIGAVDDVSDGLVVVNRRTANCVAAMAYLEHQQPKFQAEPAKTRAPC